MAHFTTSYGLSLLFTDEGAGLPILCLAGLTRTTADFDYVTPHLAGNRLIKLDYRGRGDRTRKTAEFTCALPLPCARAKAAGHCRRFVMPCALLSRS